MFFKHETDFYSWYYGGNNRNADWVERGVMVRQHILPGYKVLDLCSGDGIYPYLFYSDIAASIDALDFTEEAITYSKKYHSDKKINYYQSNILTDAFPANDYDVVAWNAGLDYFSEKEQKELIAKIIGASKKSVVLIGMVPLTEAKDIDMNHKAGFSDNEQLISLFSQFFNKVEVTNTVYIHRTSINFTCSNPK